MIRIVWSVWITDVVWIWMMICIVWSVWITDVVWMDISRTFAAAH